MQYEQTITLNLAAVGTITDCLQYADRVAGLAGGEWTAWIAWQNTSGDNHSPSEALPSNVAVPLWFSYYSGGVNLGHVVWSVPGSGFYSSPYSISKAAQYQQGTNTRAVLPSIAEVERIYGVKYVGWSEYISGEQVIKGDNMPTITQEALDDYEHWKAIGQQLSYTKAWAAIGGDPSQVQPVFNDLDKYASFVKGSPAWQANGDLTKLSVVPTGSTAPLDVQINGTEYVPKG